MEYENLTSSQTPDEGDQSPSNEDHSVPQVIQEQIPDFYRGIITPRKNLHEEIQWIDSETSETHSQMSQEKEDTRPFSEEKRVAVLCEKNGFVSVPTEEEATKNFSLNDIVSL